MADDIEALKLRITELENKLNELTTGPAPTAISAEEVAAYHKVAAVACGHILPSLVARQACDRGGYSQPCVAAALDDAEIQGAVACHGCGRGCFYYEAFHKIPQAGAAKGVSRPGQGVGRFVRLGA